MTTVAAATTSDANLSAPPCSKPCVSTELTWVVGSARSRRVPIDATTVGELKRKVFELEDAHSSGIAEPVVVKTRDNVVLADDHSLEGVDDLQLFSAEYTHPDSVMPCQTGLDEGYNRFRFKLGIPLTFPTTAPVRMYDEGVQGYFHVFCIRPINKDNAERSIGKYVGHVLSEVQHYISGLDMLTEDHKATIMMLLTKDASNMAERGVRVKCFPDDVEGKLRVTSRAGATLEDDEIKKATANKRMKIEDKSISMNDIIANPGAICTIMLHMRGFYFTYSSGTGAIEKAGLDWFLLKAGQVVTYAGLQADAPNGHHRIPDNM